MIILPDKKRDKKKHRCYGRAEPPVIAGMILFLVLLIGAAGAGVCAETTDKAMLDAFRQQLDQKGLPVVPDAVLPEDAAGSGIFVASGTGPGKAAFHAGGVENFYRFKAVWNDRGTRLRVLENRAGLTEAEYIRRFGNGPPEARQLPAGYLYQADPSAAFLKEPGDYDSYQWEMSADGISYQAVNGGTAASLVTEVFYGSRKYRCRAVIHEKEFILGEDYMLQYYSLPKQLALRLEAL